MNRYGLFTRNGTLIVTRNRYLQIGVKSFLEDPQNGICHPDRCNAIFIDVESLTYITDLGFILKYAVDNYCPVIFICTDGEMSIVLKGRFSHLDSRDNLCSWYKQLVTLLSPNLSLYYMRAFNEFLLLSRLGFIRLMIVSLINRGCTFDDIARQLGIPQKSLYRYINSLSSYFSVKSSKFLFYFLKTKFPPYYFDSRLKEYLEKIPRSSLERLQPLALS